MPKAMAMLLDAGVAGIQLASASLSSSPQSVLIAMVSGSAGLGTNLASFCSACASSAPACSVGALFAENAFHMDVNITWYPGEAHTIEQLWQSYFAKSLQCWDSRDDKQSTKEVKAEAAELIGDSNF